MAYSWGRARQPLAASLAATEARVRCLRTADAVDHYVCSALLGCERTDGSNRIVHSSNLYGFVGSEASGVFHLLFSLHDSNHAQAAELCHLHEHQSDRSGADDYD